jgi:uncharacterized protein (TIGR02145 family)
MRYFGYVLTPDWVLGSGFIEEIPENSNNTHQFEISKGIPCVSIPTVTYYGVTYNTLQIGTQCWFKENLRVGTMVPGIQEMSDNDTIEKYCWGDHEDACDKWGGLYQGLEAMGYSYDPGARGICPLGWHIPTDEEFKQLEGFVDSHYDYPDPIWDSAGYRGYDVGQRLKSADWWEYSVGSNSVGFTAIGTGCRFIDGTFLNMQRYTSIWTSDQIGTSFGIYRYMEDWEDRTCRSSAPKTMGRSV